MEYLKPLMAKNFIEYASYVIKDRAISQIEDGLKPVQRRILHSLSEIDDGKFNKVANVVGHTMKYHPHGDASIFAALVQVANREYFIEKQGNFGNIFTGDDASAARYIECRLTPLAKEVLFSKEITEFVDSYDGRNKEPVFFPCKIPYTLLAGIEGIAVGMSTKILPHNFNEVLQAQISYLKNEPYTIFPDFLQGGKIDVSEYEKGNGKVKVRAEIEQTANKNVTIKEIPFGTTTESLIASIENAAKKGKIKINSINDFTGENVEIEIILSKGYDTQDAIKALYAFTDCEYSISVNLIVIENGKPVNLTVNEVLEKNTDQLVANLKLELEIELVKQQEKLHFKTLEQIFIENRIYKDIEECKTYELVKKAVLVGVNKFRELLQRDVNDDDVEKLLQIQIKKISRYDIEKNRREINEINNTIKEIHKNLKNIVFYTISFLENLIKKYGENYPRKTKIEDFEEISLQKVAIKNVKVGYDKNEGFIGSNVKSEKLLEMTSYDKLLLIFKNGSYKVINIPEKLFVGKQLLYFEIINKKTIFNLIYREKDTKFCYLKRFSITQFILEKEYQLFDEKTNKLEILNTKENYNFTAEFEFKKGLKITSQDFCSDNFLVKGVSAKGVRLANKNIVKFKTLFGSSPNQEESDNFTPNEPEKTEVKDEIVSITDKITEVKEKLKVSLDKLMDGEQLEFL
ncbi:DNA topoisomerase IV subunit A [bacterium]|nr:DNA topoisomerase IV subunit A [bacterium]